jgi:putative endonuclease
MIIFSLITCRHQWLARLDSPSRRGRDTRFLSCIYMFKIYWIIDSSFKKTYIGFSDNLRRRVSEHKNKKVKTTKNFNNFRVFILENVENIALARKKEKYWKSAAGRKKLKEYFEKIKNEPPSSLLRLTK